MIKLAYINSIVYLGLNQNAAAFYKLKGEVGGGGGGGNGGEKN